MCTTYLRQNREGHWLHEAYIYTLAGRHLVFPVSITDACFRRRGRMACSERWIRAASFGYLLSGAVGQTKGFSFTERLVLPPSNLSASSPRGSGPSRPSPSPP